jgi:hypothetical protein
LSVYFVADVVAGIVYYYDELASLWPIPRAYLSKCSLAQLAESVALELRASSSTFTPATFSSTVGGSGADVQAGQSGSDGRGGQDGHQGGQEGGEVAKEVIKAAKEVIKVVKGVVEVVEVVEVVGLVGVVVVEEVGRRRKLSL